jgi:hypothetical protein
MVSKDDDYPPIANDDPLSTGLSGGNQIAKHVSRCLLIVVSAQVVVAVGCCCRCHHCGVSSTY